MPHLHWVCCYLDPVLGTGHRDHGDVVVWQQAGWVPQWLDLCSGSRLLLPLLCAVGSWGEQPLQRVTTASPGKTTSLLSPKRNKGRAAALRTQAHVEGACTGRSDYADVHPWVRGLGAKEVAGVSG